MSNVSSQKEEVSEPDSLVCSEDKMLQTKAPILPTPEAGTSVPSSSMKNIPLGIQWQTEAAAQLLTLIMGEASSQAQFSEGIGETLSTSLSEVVVETSNQLSNCDEDKVCPRGRGI